MTEKKSSPSARCGIRLRHFLQAFVVVFLISSFGCSLFESEPENGAGKDEKKKDEKKEDRFAFLRREEQKKLKEVYETIEMEQISAKQQTQAAVPDAKLKALEESRVVPGAAGSASAPAGGDGKDGKGGKGAKAPAKKKFYDDFILLNGDEEIAVSLIFNSAPLLDVLSAFADVLGFNFVADSDMKSTITLNLNSKMTRRELWATFEHMISLAGGAVKVEDSLLRIMLRAKVRTQPEARPGRDGNSDILFFPLSTATAREAMNQIRPFLSVGGICSELTRPNAGMVSDSPENVEKIRQLLECIDRNSKANWPRAVVNCRNVLPSKLISELQEVLPVLGLNVVKNTDRAELPGSVQLVGLDRLQVVVASAATQEAVKTIREWIGLLDSRDATDQERVFVYKVRHNKAAHLAQALATIYETQGASLSIDTSTGRTRMENVVSARARVTSVPNTTGLTARNNRTAAANAIVNTSTDRESNVFEKTIKVFADGMLNRLVIRTTPRTYASIKALLDRLDVVPAQVLLQVLVVEVTLSESTQFGLEFSGQETGNKVTSLFGTNYSNGMNPFAQVYNTTTKEWENSDQFKMGADRQNGGTFVIADPNNPQSRFGYIRAMAGDGLVKVLSSPQLLVSSHTKASINVGQDVPVISSGITSTSSNGSQQYNYRYVSTGVILTVTPQITSNDLISLEIKQELSQAVTTTSSQIQSPTISQRTVETAMTIANGQTMVIGGLIQERKDDTLNSIPIINKIPILNRLAGNTDARVERSEVLVLVTGHIVNEHSPVEDMIKRYDDAIKELSAFDKRMGDRPDAGKKPALMTSKDFWL
ncbi:MAG: hypothetical protein IJU70_11120 [Lentisphaeria bacterium]|nr:hypothetical protein [Lentisphaeria bacterium]